MNKYLYFLMGFIMLSSCNRPSQVEPVLVLAGDNRTELEEVILHYDSLNDSRKKVAAEFLIANMLYNKYSYEGEIISHYDPIIDIYASFCKDSIILDEDPHAILQAWDSISKRHGLIDASRLGIRYDYQTLTSDFLIRNIDLAFEAWENSPYYKEENLDLFYEYILPYRIQNEPVEEFRKRYYDELKMIVDSASTIQSLIHGFYDEFYKNLGYRNSKLLWNYPLELPISKMELGRRGACRQITTFYALCMRAAGLPVTIDRAIWANRSQGHSWNVLFIEKDSIFPFDALAKKKLIFSYKPAKIFRKTFSYDVQDFHGVKPNDLPASFLTFDEKDVTHEYVSAYDVTIPLQEISPIYQDKRQAIICVFDNANWRPVYWGNIEKRDVCFKNMASGIMYIAAFYDNGQIIPASDPFLLRDNGEIQFCRANSTRRINMRLNRKYPRFLRIEYLARHLLNTTVEGANNPKFNNNTVLFTIQEAPVHVTDSLVNHPDKFRYVRFNPALSTEGNYAEIEFYGKKNLKDEEQKLEGKAIGYPAISPENTHPYTHTIDGNFETYYNKRKNQSGWAGFDLGEPFYITRVRYCPRSDTNFIMKGDEYELFYWGGNKWNSLGRKTAKQYNYITFEEVPSGTMYLLHNLSGGKEERIFTYEEEEQVWW
ncbi:transglutaminase-like domain-containing protein [Bacteroidales bacterium OttesenSCG-928-L03]|nr:transglutaminase-like domain-containing protein [Bacteroidales bacterium OttesenSCG-928-L03]